MAVTGAGPLSGKEGAVVSASQRELRCSPNAVAQARGGLSEMSGEADGPPAFVGAAVGDTIPGLWTALGIVMAIQQRHKTGVGQFIDVAMYDSLATMCYKPVSDYSTTGVAPTRGGEGWLGTFTTILKCREGDVAMSLWGGHPERWKAFWQLVGHPEYFDNPNYNHQTPGAKEDAKKDEQHPPDGRARFALNGKSHDSGDAHN